MSLRRDTGNATHKAVLTSSIFLSLGSLLLLVWSLHAITSSGFGPLLSVGLFTYPALGAHLLGWMYLWRASRGSSRLRRIFLASIIGFVLGLVTLPWVGPKGMVPVESDSIAFIAAALRVSLFPYVPSVFAPVVVPHALMFALSAQSQGGRPWLVPVLVGAGFLFALAVTGLSLQTHSLVVGRTPNDWLLTLAGLTSVGYVLFALSRNRIHSNGSDESDRTA